MLCNISSLAMAGWLGLMLKPDPMLAQQDGVTFFETHVRPILVDHCYECHAQEKKIKGGLRLDIRQGWEKGGDSGPSILPGNPDESLLVEAIEYTDPDLEMPPKGRLSHDAIETLKRWVQMGAPDPRDGTLNLTSESIDLEQGRQFWSFQPIGSPTPPSLKDATWPQNEVDRFIRSSQESEGVTPNADASPTELLRRLSFDLTGLPPDPAQLIAFERDPSEAHYRRLVDSMLASEAFGETWGRHWLDLARYAESTGGGRSSVLANAWRYRSYVIDAFNADMPYTQFIQEQIAGDLMPHQSATQRERQLIATAFLALGPKNLDLQDKELLRMNTVDEQIETIGRSLMGMTISCARCHAHKFDPIPMEDYYAMAGILRSTRTLVLGNVSSLVEQELPVDPARKQAYLAHASASKELEQAIKQAKAIKEPTPENKQTLTRLQEELAQLKRAAPAPLPKAISVRDETQTEDYAICVRGNVHQLGDPVPRGFLKVTLSPDEQPPRIEAGQSGRMELAQWLTGGDHPLVARVYVNRLWHHLFGKGIVRSVDNFGTTGEAPTHPELLDYLARKFLDGGGSTKQLVRSLVLSRTYRLSSDNQHDLLEVDPDNNLYWRHDRRSLNAEAMRDAMLQVSGQIEHGRHHSMLPGAASTDSALNNAKLDYPQIVSPKVRSVYIPIFREEGRNALLDAFDFANPSFAVGKRTPGVRPTQSLFLMNNHWIMEQAEEAASRLLAESWGDDSLALESAYLRCLSRLPSPSEAAIHLTYLSLPTSQENPSKAWSGIFHALFSCVDFRYL
jgi:hypothetical protein